MRSDGSRDNGLLPSQRWREAAESIKQARAGASSKADKPSKAVEIITEAAQLVVGAGVVSVAAVASSDLVSQAVANVSSPWSALAAGTAAAVGYLGFDAIYGLGHAFLDQARPSAFPWPLNKLLLASQRHHLTPRDVTDAGVFDYMAPAALLATPIILGATHLDPSAWVSAATLGFTTALTIVLDVHRYTHVPKGEEPEWILATRAIGATQSRNEHWGHHANDNKNVCQLTNYVNPMFNRLRVYDRIGDALKRRGLHVEQAPNTRRELT